MKVRKRPHPSCLGQKKRSDGPYHMEKMRTSSEVPPVLYTRSGLGGNPHVASEGGALALKSVYDHQRAKNMARWGWQKDAKGIWSL